MEIFLMKRHNGIRQIMRRRPSAQSAVSSIDDATSLKENISAGKRKRLRGSSRSSVFIPVLSLFILLTGVLLLRFSSFSSAGDGTYLSEKEKVAVFMDWFRSAGGSVSDKIAIETFPEMGRGGFIQFIERLIGH
ncbi:hypothetical protein P3T76_004427 [Phytophthora citrophthora]|uniref:Uncharacterized protein n=1 Tax=Phytophthora citrophthora TaxID=4793 RepID=A0AAD9GTF0_9STRA|nr:hypothetical protein P3T76_004427 [Phytophthora citrophthora]